MKNENKNTLISLEKKFAKDSIEQLTKEIESMKLYGDPQTFDNCYALIAKITERVDSLKSIIST